MDNDFHNPPVTVVRHPDGSVVMVEINMAGRPVHAQVWRVQVGRVSLYLLDTNIPANALPEDRNITNQL